MAALACRTGGSRTSRPKFDTSPGRRAAGLALRWVVGRLVSVLAWRAAASCLHAISKLLPWATQRAGPTGTGVGTGQRFRCVDDDRRGAAAGAYPPCRAGAGQVGFRSEQ